jgi:hypothetical protein
MVITVKGESQMSMSKVAVKVAREELQNRGFTVRLVRATGKFIVRNPQVVRNLYEAQPPAYSAEELVTMAGSRVLDRFQKRGSF